MGAILVGWTSWEVSTFCILDGLISLAFSSRQIRVGGNQTGWAFSLFVDVASYYSCDMQKCMHTEDQTL